MAIETPCQTPDATYSISINHSGIELRVNFGRELKLNESEAILLEANLHNAVELVLGRHWK